MANEKPVVHWRFRESADADTINLCDATPKQTARDGSIILKPHTKLGKYVGTCPHCHEIGRAHGLIHAAED